MSTGVMALGEMGDKLAKKVPMRLVHAIAAAIFGLLGLRPPKCGAS